MIKFTKQGRGCEKMKNDYQIKGENIVEDFVIKFKEKTLANTVRNTLMKKTKFMIIIILFYFVSDIISKIARIYGNEWENYNEVKNLLFCIIIVFFVISILKDTLKTVGKGDKFNKKNYLQDCLDRMSQGAKKIRQEDNRIIKKLLKKNHLYDIEIMKEIKEYCNQKRKPEDSPTKKMINSFKILIVPILIAVITSIMFQKDALENLISSLEIWSILIDILLTSICIATFVYLLDYLEGTKNTDSYERISNVLSNLIIIEIRKSKKVH